MLSDVQLLTIALATVPTLLVVTIGIFLNNNRLNDVKDTLRAEIDSKVTTTREAILSQMATYQMDIISKIAELDNRITRLER